MADVRAVVLAAGRGVRMGGKQPKALIPMGDKQPLLHYILQGVEIAGIKDLLIVTGFGHDQIQSYVADTAGKTTAVLVRNARYASWGNFHSLRVALDQSPGADVLVINCDVVVPPDIYDRVVKQDGDLVLAVERRSGLDHEDMRVELDGDRVRAIGKEIKMVRSHGEFCGVSLVRPRAAAAFGDVCNQLEWSAGTSLYYEDVYARLLGALDARSAPVEAGEYAEVDEPGDVAQALEVISSHESKWDK